jgi:hypothetical protein
MEVAVSQQNPLAREIKGMKDIEFWVKTLSQEDLMLVYNHIEDLKKSKLDDLEEFEDV